MKGGRLLPNACKKGSLARGCSETIISAGFCLITNGTYLATAAIQPVGDAEDLLRLGTPLYAVAVPGVLAFSGGLALWSGLGRDFGFAGGTLSGRWWVIVAIVLIAELAGMLWWSRVP